VISRAKTLARPLHNRRAMCARTTTLVASILSCLCGTTLLLRGGPARAASDQAADDEAPSSATATTRRHHRPSTISAEPEGRNGLGLQVEFAGGLGQDATTTRTDIRESDGGLALLVGVGTAVLYGPLTAGVRVDLAPVVLGGTDNRYFLADIGAHVRLGAAKLTGLAEIGSHQLIDASTFVGPTTSGSAVLPSLGARASIDISSGNGPMIGWWAEVHQDLGTVTIAPYSLGGLFVASGLQVGFDLQIASR
jgi:hypothetical protein